MNTGKLNDIVEAQRILLGARGKVIGGRTVTEYTANFTAWGILKSAFEYLQDQYEETLEQVCTTEGK